MTALPVQAGHPGFAFATQQQAEDGENTSNVMNPLRTLQAILAAPFLQAGAGAVERTIISKLKDRLSVRDFGAVGNGTTDDMDAINDALAYGTSARVPVHFEQGDTYGISDTIVSQGADMIGHGMFRARIVPLPGFDNTHEVVKYEPVTAGEYFSVIENLMIFPAFGSGGTKGKTALLVKCNSGITMPRMLMSRLDLRPANDWAFDFDHTGAATASAGVVFRDINCLGGTRVRGLGDSCRFEGGVYKSDSTSRAGLDVSHFAGAGGTVFLGVNGGGACAEAIVIRNGRALKIDTHNLELIAGATGGSNKAVLHLSGDEGTIIGAVIDSGKGSCFGAGNTVEKILRIDHASFVEVKGYTWLSNGTGSPIPQAIEITSNAKDTLIDSYIIGTTGQFTTVIADSGVRTAGIWKNASGITVAAGSGTITTAAATCRFRREKNNMIRAHFEVTITTNGTGATNIQLSLPTPCTSTEFTGSGTLTAGGSGVGLKCRINGGNALIITKYDNTYPGGDSFVLKVDITYEGTATFNEA